MIHNDSQDRMLFSGNDTRAAAPAAADITRRGLLKGLGFVAVGFTFLKNVSPAAAASFIRGQGTELNVGLVDSWIAIGEDETVTLFSSRIDNGHGTMTGFLQIMSEELDIPFKNARAVYGDTALTPDDGGTGGVDGIQMHGPKVRQAAATARSGLLKLASEHFGVPTTQLSVSDGIIHVANDPQRTISYGKLIGGRQLDLQIDGSVPVKRPEDYKIVGQPIPRIDLVTKTTGEAQWVGDIRVPGMVHARVVRTTGWSSVPDKILNVDESSVADVPGLIKVVPVDLPGMPYHFVGVVCEREEQAVKAAEKLNVTWAEAPKLPDDLHAGLVNRVSMVEETGIGGDVDTALKSAAKIFKSSYRTPSQLKSPIMPAIALADVKVVDGKVESAHIWSSIQRVGMGRAAIGKALGIPEDEIPSRVRVTFVHGAGTFGTGNGNTITIVEAALLSKAVGKPVRLQWSRAQQLGFDYAWPEQMFNFTAGLDGDNNISAWEYQHYGTDQYIEPIFTGRVWYDGSDYKFAQKSANYRMTSYVSPSYVPSSYIRGVTSFPTFGVECFLDEIAAYTRVDPLAFRHKYMNYENKNGYRRKELLEKISTAFKWEERPSPDPANADKQTGTVRGRGLAYSEGPFAHSFSAAMIEIEVNQDSGEIKLLRVVEGMDAGLIINPILAKDQVEGSIIQAASRALYEERKTDGHRVAVADWNEYPLIRFDNIPQIDAILINRPNELPGAFGDTALDPICAAIGNAIFDATGARLREFPFTPERVLAALKERPSKSVA